MSQVFEVYMYKSCGWDVRILPFLRVIKEKVLGSPSSAFSYKRTRQREGESNINLNSYHLVLATSL